MYLIYGAFHRTEEESDKYIDAGISAGSLVSSGCDRRNTSLCCMLRIYMCSAVDKLSREHFRSTVS